MSDKRTNRMQEPLGPREGLEAVVALRRLLEGLEAAHVERAYEAGWTWAEMAEVLGVSKQAVHRKHAKRIGGRA
ncbi:hypothetical protein [Rubrobacter indicoceani]|uniref:hypothetical protein n=1 Tax=Rubrobacter indicoceani TaxID=2051957 RepID=UPI000E5AD957|nr:hypothetical protein [Rubrobacter indicoceani]